MRAYTLSVLTSLANSNSPIIEKEIVAWVNKKLESAGKTSSLRNFNDSTIASGKVVIDLVDSIKPGSVNYDLVKDGETEEVCLFLQRKKKKTLFNFSQIINKILFKFIRIVWQMQNMPYHRRVKLVHVFMHYLKI